MVLHSSQPKRPALRADKDVGVCLIGISGFSGLVVSRKRPVRTYQSWHCLKMDRIDQPYQFFGLRPAGSSKSDDLLANGLRMITLRSYVLTRILQVHSAS